MEIDQIAETSVAVISLKPNGTVVTRFKDDAKIDREGILENIAARRRICADKTHALITIVPPDALFATTDLSINMFPDVQDRACITAIALVAPPGVTGMIARLYFSCFPDVAVTRVFSEEEDALRWLDEVRTVTNN